MEETFVKNIIQGFNRYYSYGIIELNDYGLSTNWALVKALDINEKRVIVFVNPTNVIDYSAMAAGLKALLNCPNIELIRILIKDTKEEALYTFDNDQKAELVLDIYNGKILGSGLSSEEVVQELLNVTNSIQKEVPRKSSIPYITYILIGINLLVYLITAFLSQNFIDSDINVLIKLGAKYNELISQGEYYRFVSSMFLHGGLLHVALNMYSLYSIGPLIEKVFGKAKYVIIYFVSGITGSIFSYLFSDSVSIGASGAIFGLLGGALIFAFKVRNSLGKEFLRSVVSVIAINLFIGFTMPNIDNYAHLGGLTGGVIVTLLLSMIKQRNGAKAE
ncbi:rhomboid family intramembrane serine protease [Candidatus Clostridium stratigraminis]|uniref:Rhomboid family intramembrane serine protease n=1 Tax=Candidatus Clostridium stratigraminis TaxID=3381661 RepID=A0ABW8T2R3_9CLOT